MDLSGLTAKIKNLENQNNILQNEVSSLKIIKDIEEIKKLQTSYGYYVEHLMFEEIIDLFADDPDVALWHAGLGAYKGKEGIKNFFYQFSIDSQNPEFLHQVIMVSPYITVDPDGKTAKGRWYGLAALAIPHGKGVIQTNSCIIYENDYIKQGGIWKMKMFRIWVTYDYTPGRGFVKPERIAAADVQAVRDKFAAFERGELKPEKNQILVPANVSDDSYPWYPTGYIVPFHFKHPVTGKETSEKVRNSSLKQIERDIHFI
jgi:hypothetical protein